MVLDNLSYDLFHFFDLNGTIQTDLESYKSILIEISLVYMALRSLLLTDFEYYHLKRLFFLHSDRQQKVSDGKISFIIFDQI